MTKSGDMEELQSGVKWGVKLGLELEQRVRKVIEMRRLELDKAIER